jgi:hypothetical protein
MLNIDWPLFEVVPDTIFVNLANTLMITATDCYGDPIPGINLTVWARTLSSPDPLETNEDGMVEFSIEPLSSGTANVTIVRGLEYDDGQLLWDLDDSIITDTTIDITSIRSLTLSVSKSPIYEGETLVVTAKSGDMLVAGVDVEFGESTGQTDSAGEVSFTVPDPGVDSAIYTLVGSKTGYATTEKSITVIKKHDITVIGLSGDITPGSKFTVSIIAKGGPLAGATISFNGQTSISDANGKVTLTAPSKKGDYTIIAEYEGFNDGELIIKIKDSDIPGFDILLLLIAFGIVIVSLIIVKRRRK